MAQRYIYLSEELNSKLKEEANASKLIQDLLTEHYNKSIKPSFASMQEEINNKVIEEEKKKNNKIEEELEIKKNKEERYQINLRIIEKELNRQLDIVEMLEYGENQNKYNPYEFANILKRR